MVSVILVVTVSGDDGSSPVWCYATIWNADDLIEI